MLIPLVMLFTMNAEPNEAENLFRSMEKKVNSAKTVECKFEGKVEAGTTTFSYMGSLTFAEGNKVRIETSFDRNVMGKMFELISDGKQMQAVVDRKTQGKKDIPKRFGEIANAMFSRAGVGLSLFTPSDNSTAEKDFKVDDELRLSGFALGKVEKIGDNEAQVIQFILNAKQHKNLFSVTIWVDKKTDLPLKRVIEAEMDGVKGRFTEIYSKLNLDGKIDPKTFELPKE